MNRNIEGEAVDAVSDVFSTEYAFEPHYKPYIESLIVRELLQRRLLVGEIDGKDTLALESIRERHKARLEAEKDGVFGGIRDDFEVVRLLGIIDKLLRVS